MHTHLEILPNAVFVADAHYSKARPWFLDFLHKINSGEIVASQLFLLGDCFDFLSSSNSYSVFVNRNGVKLLRKIAKKIPVFYFEGNHDFNLEPILHGIKVFKFYEQPLVFSFNNQKIAIMHGDRFESWHYQLYSFIIRNNLFLKFLYLVLRQYKHNSIIKNLYLNLQKKHICNKNIDFLNFRLTKIRNIDDLKGIDCLIEGHFHQNVQLRNNSFFYCNLGAFACDKSFFQVQSINSFELSEVCIDYKEL